MYVGVFLVVGNTKYFFNIHTGRREKRKLCLLRKSETEFCLVC